VGKQQKNITDGTVPNHRDGRDKSLPKFSTEASSVDGAFCFCVNKKTSQMVLSRTIGMGELSRRQNFLHKPHQLMGLFCFCVNKKHRRCYCPEPSGWESM